MDEKDFQQAEQLVDAIGNMLTEEKIEVPIVLSALVSMLVSTALNQTSMNGIQLIRLFSQAVEKYEDETQLRKEDDEQADGRTTH